MGAARVLDCRFWPAVPHGGARCSAVRPGAARRRRLAAAAFAAALSAGCQVPPPESGEEPLTGHISQGRKWLPLPAPASPVTGWAPAPVDSETRAESPSEARTESFSETRAELPSETYTVVVDQVPVEELLFALARDAEINVDVHPDISGRVTLNAVDQTLTQLLDRISHQVRLRHEMRGDSLLILPDRPFLRAYRLDYVNVARDTTSGTRTTTAVATPAGGASENASATEVVNVSSSSVWETVTSALREIVRPIPGSAESGSDSRETVVASPESGVIMVRARARQHDSVRAYLDAVAAGLQRQVLIETTIVEVNLDDRFQAGVDWRSLVERLGVTVRNVAGSAIAPSSAGVTGLLLDYSEESDGMDLSVVLRLLETFGHARVLSSPKLMALNNQAAVLKVVDNEVYFSVDIKEEKDAESGDSTQEVTSTVNTVPVGLVMNVTPHVGDDDSVSLNIRPTITRIREFVNDPGVAIAAARLGVGTGAAVVNRVPVVQVRETETMMRVESGQVAVLGGLMQERRSRRDDGVPGLRRLGFLSPLLGYRDRQLTKTELIIFLRATVVRAPSIESDFRDYRHLLPGGGHTHGRLPAPPAPVGSWTVP